MYPCFMTSQKFVPTWEQYFVHGMTYFCCKARVVDDGRNKRLCNLVRMLKRAMDNHRAQKHNLKLLVLAIGRLKFYSMNFCVTFVI